MKDTYAYIKAYVSMRLAIVTINKIHKLSCKSYLFKNDKNIINYIVVLELPIINSKKHIVENKQSVRWVNRNNFRELRRKGWISKNTTMNELKHKSFYYNNPNRTYTEEYIAKKNAVNKYYQYLITR